jgi:hypothetical protein
LTNDIWTVRSSLRLSEDASVVDGETLSRVSEYSNAVASGIGIQRPCVLVMLTGCVVASIEREEALAGSVLLPHITFFLGRRASNGALPTLLLARLNSLPAI